MALLLRGATKDVTDTSIMMPDTPHEDASHILTRRNRRIIEGHGNCDGCGLFWTLPSMNNLIIASSPDEYKSKQYQSCRNTVLALVMFNNLKPLLERFDDIQMIFPSDQKYESKSGFRHLPGSSIPVVSELLESVSY